MTLLRRATDDQQSDWRPVPEGLFRWIVGVPELKLSERFNKYQAKFPLVLTQAEKDRVKNDLGDPPEGKQQSWRASYSTGLSLGYFKMGKYETTKLVDFLAACLGTGNAKPFRKWVMEGGGPPAPEDKNDPKAELENIGEWLAWWENLEVYGTVTHGEDSQDPTKIWARWAGPMPVGSLPGQPDADYQALGRGKLRAMLAETEVAENLAKQAPRELVGVVAPPAQQFTAQGEQVVPLIQDDLEDLPF